MNSKWFYFMIGNYSGPIGVAANSRDEAVELLKNKYASKYGKDIISQIVLVDSVASTFDAISIYAVDFIPEPPWKYCFTKKENKHG